MQSKYFFSFTRTFSDQIGDATTFLWSSYCGFWHVYESAKALGGLSTSPQWAKIEEHLFRGIPKAGGIDLRALSSESWDRHESRFAAYVLTQGAVLFEEWAADLAGLVTAQSLKVKPETFQFPSGKGGAKYDNWAALDLPGKISESAFLKAELQPGLVARRAKNIADLDKLLKWYRFFKEMRNCVVHNGGMAEARVIAAYANAGAHPLKSLGINRDYPGPAPVAQAKLTINARDSVLMLAVIARIAYAFDAKYCHTAGAEQDLHNRISARLKERPPNKGFSLQRKQQFLSQTVARHIGVSPRSWPAMFAWLTSRGLT